LQLSGEISLAQGELKLKFALRIRKTGYVYKQH